MSKIIKIVLGIIVGLLLAGLAAVTYLYFIAGTGVTLPDISIWFPSSTTDKRETSRGNETGVQSSAEVSALRKISSNATSGATIVKKMDGYHVLFIERENGNLFDYSLETGTSLRLSNTTIPRVQEARFTSDGTRVALRYLSDGETVETYLANVPTTIASDTEEIALAGNFLPRNIVSLSTHPTKVSLFYLTPSNPGVQGFLTTNGTAMQNIYSSRLSEWSTEWVSDSRIAFTTRPSGLTSGYLYLFNTGTRTFDRVLGNILGLTANFAPDEKRLLYSERTQNAIALWNFNILLAESNPLSISTLPEKCVWSKVETNKAFCAVPQNIENATYPDDWYQGALFFTDDLWGVDTTTGEAELLFDLSSLSKSEIDVIDPVLSSDESLLIFRNKRDSSLWSLDLPTP